MKILTVLVVALGFAGAAVADPVDGLWQTEVDDGAYAYVRMGPCRGKICGVIERTFNSGGEYQSDNLGKTLVIDMIPSGGANYKGSVWRPSNNKIYIGRIRLSGNTLTLKGCVAGGLLCSGQNWMRVE